MNINNHVLSNHLSDLWRLRNVIRHCNYLAVGCYSKDLNNIFSSQMHQAEKLGQNYADPDQQKKVNALMTDAAYTFLLHETKLRESTAASISLEYVTGYEPLQSKIETARDFRSAMANINEIFHTYFTKACIKEMKFPIAEELFLTMEIDELKDKEALTRLIVSKVFDQLKKNKTAATSGFSDGLTTHKREHSTDIFERDSKRAKV